LTSRVLPPSSENACSNRHDVGVMSERTFRTSIALPLNDLLWAPLQTMFAVRSCGQTGIANAIVIPDLDESGRLVFDFIQIAVNRDLDEVSPFGKRSLRIEGRSYVHG
jgi:hypothetical protein